MSKPVNGYMVKPFGLCTCNRCCARLYIGANIYNAILSQKKRYPPIPFSFEPEKGCLFAVALAEFVNLARGLQYMLLAGVERM